VRQNRTLRTLAQISQEFSHILQLKELLSKIASLVRNLIPYDALSIFLMERDAAILKHYFGVRYDERVRAASMPLGKGIVGTAALTQQPVLVRDTSKDERYVAALEGIRSEVAIPLMLQDQVVGVLDLESEQFASFTKDHVQTLSLLAPQLASAIENARLYEEVAHHKERLEIDLTAARELQKLLLPAALPVWEGIEIAACNQAATEISGDLYDFFPFSGNHVGFLIGDVSGKGAAAALYAALVSGILRNQAQTEQTPADLMVRVNEALLRRKVEALYLTALYAQWYPQTRRLVLCSAGQPQPVLCRAGRAQILPLAGYPLGMFELSDYENVEQPMQPGDIFVAVSDGITDAGYPSKRPYGEERLMRLIEANCSLSAPRLLKAICDDIGAYTEGLPQEDDRTVIVARIHE
jgi:sigma-B regulation protein RsbU (phosphoserine phosphatase)